MRHTKFSAKDEMNNFKVVRSVHFGSAYSFLVLTKCRMSNFRSVFYRSPEAKYVCGFVSTSSYTLA